MKIIRIKQVIQATGLPRSSLYKRIAEGGFPKPVPLGGRSVGWLEAEIMAWLQRKIAERDMQA